MERYHGNVISLLGPPYIGLSPIPGVGLSAIGFTVTVLTFPELAPASIFSDNGVTPAANPILVDHDGDFAFYGDGHFQIEISKPTVLSKTISDIFLSDDQLPEDLGDVTDAVIREAVLAPSSDKQFYVATWGSDSNDGRSWKTAKLTPAAGHALLTGNVGDLYFSAGIFTISDTITLGQSQRWRGRSWHDSPGHGTEFQWAGADDGRAMFSFSGSTDTTKQCFENFRIKGTAGMTGGGACLDLRNLQNGSVIKNVHLSSWANGPSFLLRDSIANSVNYPGYVILENCWASGLSSYGFRIESGTTGVLMINCACDATAGQIAPFYFTMKSEASVAITACSQVGNNATYTAAGHGLAAGNFVQVKGVTPAGYNGMYRVASAAGNDFVLALNRTGLAAGSAFGTSTRKRAGTRGVITMLNCKSECADVSQPSILSETNQQIIVIGLNSRAVTSTGSASLIQWDGPKVDDTGDPLLTPPVSVIGCHAQNRGTLLRADRFGPDNGTFEIINSDPGGGRSCLFNFMPGYSYTPVIDFVPMLTPASPEANNKRMFLNSATGQLSVVNSSGTVVSLET